MSEWIQVSSSNVDALKYENEVVFVRFQNGTIYIYKGVPEQEFNNLANAPSIGSYLHQNFKNVYPYEKIG